MFENCPFTFLVGPEEKELLVHSSLISKTSLVLDRLMNGSMRESRERIARLPELEPETFQNFLSYTYFFTLPRQEANGVSSGRTTDSKVIELLLLNDHETFKCKQCEQACQLRFSTSFPRCYECHSDRQPALKWSSRCVVWECPEGASFLHSLICGYCLERMRVLDSDDDLTDDGLENIQLKFPKSLKELTRFHFDIPLRAKELAQVFQESTHGMHLPCTDLLEIGRLALFAHLYDVPLLFEAACLGLYKELAFQQFDDESLEKILELIRLVYQGTPESEDEDFGEKHTLRRMLSEFVATHCEHFTSPTHLRALLDLGREVNGDLLIAIVDYRNKRDIARQTRW